MFLCSISLRSTGLCGFLIFLFLLEFSAKGNARTVKFTNYLQSHADLRKSYMNFSVAPCDNFYEYACGNYRNVKQDRFSTKGSVSTNDISYTLDDITEQLLGMSDLAESLNVSSELRVAQRFYNACLGADLYPFPAADPNYLKLIRSIGGFPAVDGAAWNASNFNWFNMSAHLTNYGTSGFIREKLQDSHPFLSQVLKPLLGFDSIVQKDSIDSNSSRVYRLNEKRMRGYLRSFQLPEDKIAEVIDGVFAFWREALVAAEINDDDIYRCSKFDYTNYLDIVWNISEHDDMCNSYLVEIEKVCARHPEAAANYMAMKLLYQFDAKLSEAKYQRDFCKRTLRTSMAFLFNKMYMAEYFTEKERLEVSEIVQELRKGFRRSLEEADWLDPETREKALLKESRIQSVIGSGEDSLRTERLIREINRLEIIDDSYAETNINLHRLSVDINRFSGRHYMELSKEALPQKVLLAMQVQAFYHVLDNSIYVLAGILQSPVYHHSWPHSLKLGTLGYVIGHELTHAFDTQGSRYDVDGKRLSWWSEKLKLGFKSTECFVKAYSKYLIPEIDRHVDGNKTVDENIADSGGLRQALEAYRSHMEQLLEDPKQDRINEQLPGLDLLPEQLFFLGFAQIFCSDYKEEHLWNQLDNEETHTIEKYRVLGTLSNIEDFFQAFNCPVGSGMRVAAETCHMW
ncbi:neprilysin-2-like [Drosophila subpulchrella]|uniref:neprilysin-2-like n=1 Tax=Drosophila subpulchrella TaxID=1486046 RepID=UPI0018A15DA0|nr:neprilysin-2-like [Drosophila subpulchrella]